jgi:hypothetical protein
MVAIVAAALALTVCSRLSAQAPDPGVPPASQPAPLALPPSPPIPISAWDGPAVSDDVVAKYQEFADAGFMYNMTAFVNEEQAKIGLDAAAKAGVKVLARFWPHSPTVRPPDMARLFKDHPGLGGYVLQDEPTISELPALLERARQVLAADPDPDKIVIVNLLPIYAGNKMIELAPYQKYEDYVFKFLSEIPVNYLSYDFYPLKRFDPIPSWYENMLTCQRAARMANIPLWSFISCCGMDLFPDPTMATLRVQAYTNLALGATGIEHFLYQACGGRVAPYDVGGRRTYAYDLVKQLNAELQARAGVFMGSTVKLMRYAGSPVPEPMKPYEPSGAITALQAGGKGAVVSILWKDDLRFLVIVNQDFINPMPLSMAWKPSVHMARVGRDGAVTMLAQPSLTEQVEAGDAVMLVWRDAPK